MQQKGRLFPGLILAGAIALVYYFSWWFTYGVSYSPWVFLLLPFAVAYAVVQIAGNWIIYLYAGIGRTAASGRDGSADGRRRTADIRLNVDSQEVAEADEGDGSGLSIDVFVTACGEPVELVARSLSAACAMEGTYCTWLLDDGQDPALQALAKRLGAGYLARSGSSDAKAGNLNAALKQTDGDIVAIFDVDHAPKRDFLRETVAYFEDPKVGFVQVMLTFDNEMESWVSKGAAETALDFYNPTSLGMDGMGGATLMGSNALLRREALVSIGGYQPGLAEDLATSLQLQAAGWHSVYVAKPLAPGLAPPDLRAWFIQQFKWARGVFELLVTIYPRVFRRLTWGQRLSYAVRMTKYWIGPLVTVHLATTILILIFGDADLRIIFHQYLRHIAPLAVADVAIRYVALKSWRHPSVHSTSFVRAIALVYSTWPTYTLAWFMALTRIPLRFQATPKLASSAAPAQRELAANGRSFGLLPRGYLLPPVWLLPQLGALLLLAAGLWYTVFVSGHRPSLLVAFAIGQALLQLRILAVWLIDENAVEL